MAPYYGTQTRFLALSKRKLHVLIYYRPLICSS